jgi:hypothetical protein
MEYNEKIVRELFNYVRYQNVIYVCHHRCPVRRHIKMNQDQTKNLLDYIVNLF